MLLFTFITLMILAIAIAGLVNALVYNPKVSATRQAQQDAVDEYWAHHVETPVYVGNYNKPTAPESDSKFINHSTDTYSAYSTRN
jgi:hypothetical protein